MADPQRILAVERMIMNSAGSSVFPLRERSHPIGKRFAVGIVDIQNELVALGFYLANNQVCAETAFPKNEEYQAACEEISSAGGIKQARRSHRDWKVYTAIKHAAKTIRRLAYSKADDEEEKKRILKNQISEDLKILDFPDWLTDDVNSALKSEDPMLLLSAAEAIFMQGALEIHENPYSWDLMDVPLAGKKPIRVLLEETGLI